VQNYIFTAKHFRLIERELYIIRHGQTDHNAKGIIQGRGIDLSLNATGKQQAKAFYEAYRHVPFNIVYTSTLKRAQESIAGFKKLGIEHKAMSELDEISWGELEGSTITHESDEKFKTLIAKWRSGDIHARPAPGGESPYEMQKRQLKFIEHLNTTPYRNVLIATHGRFIRAFMCTLTGKPLSDMETFPHSNVCLYKVNQLKSGKFEIVLHYDTEHLSAE
jgi:probable phosphoglycerate mutase